MLTGESIFQGFIRACLQPDVLQTTPGFFAGLFGISDPMPRFWDRSDATKLLTAITSLTMLFDQPGPLILTSAVIGFAGTVIFPVALYLLNHRLLAAQLPEWARPSRRSAWLLGLSFIAYFCLAVGYLWGVWID